MGRRREYEIAFVGLKTGIHEFRYEIDDRFFEEFQQQDFRNCRARVKLLLDKKSSFMQLRFEVGGQLIVTCDRCNNDLPLDLWDEFNITVKLVEDPEKMNEEESDPYMYYIGLQENHLDIAGWIYEFINLSLPIQKSCSHERMDGPYCNKEAMKVLNRINRSKKDQKENPIWKGLEKFKDIK